MTNLQRVLIMAGGTGGHVFPGLAVADDLRKRGIGVYWLGTPNSFEATVVPQANIPFHSIQITGMRGKGMKAILTSPFHISSAILQSYRIIKNIKPDAVIGMGGFASGPGGVAAWLAHCPLFIHEQNAKAGLTNKLLTPIAKKVLAGFPDSFPKNKAKIKVIGNPVRSELSILPLPKERLKNRSLPLRLLVIGGSLGALALNKILPASLACLDQNLMPEVLHQTGRAHLDITLNFYQQAGLEKALNSQMVRLVPFIEDMAHAYAWADVVLCRAGALTVAELCMVGLGAILIPFPYAVDDHQTANASYMVKGDAAFCIQQTDLDAACLAENLKNLTVLPEKRLAMAMAAHRLRYEHVTEKIFAVLSEVSEIK